MGGNNSSQHLRPRPAWLPLLSPVQREWREDQLRLGNDPDPFLEAKLIRAGKWQEAQPRGRQDQQDEDA